MLYSIYKELKESENNNILEISMLFLRLPKEVLRYNCLKQTSKDSIHQQLQQIHSFFYFNYLFLLIGFTRHIRMEIRGRDRFDILPTLFWKGGFNYRNGWSLHGGLFVQEKNSPCVSLLWVQWLTPLKTQCLCVCWQKSLQYRRFNSNTWHKIFWQNEPSITSNTVERQTSQPTKQFYQTPDSSILLLWQTQNYFCLIEYLRSRWKCFRYRCLLCRDVVHILIWQDSLLPCSKL